MRNENERLITELFESLGNHYQSNNLAESEVIRDHDVHAFYRLAHDPSLVIHLQGYPGFSSVEEGAKVSGRVMEYDAMMKLRSQGNSPGNEHEAVIVNLFNFHEKVIPYNHRVLEGILAEYVHRLRK